MQQDELFELVIDGLAELATLHAAAAATADRVWSALAEHDDAASEGIFSGSFPRECLQQHRLIIDATTFTVKWRAQSCHLGPTILFTLIQRLARRPERYLTCDTLMEDVWQRRCSDTAIRSAIKRLRRALHDAGMSEVAAAIRARGKRYGLFLGDGDL
mgnify:CR=1 FL=1